MEPYAVPLRAEKVEQWKEFSRQVRVTRRAEFDAMNRRYGLTEHSAYLEKLPDGGYLVIVIREGPGTSQFLAKLGQSTHPFDVWFREQISDAHGIDFALPVAMEPPQLMIESHV